VVLDTSALLAVCFEETAGAWVTAQMERYSSELMMSTVNYAELLILIAERRPALKVEFLERMRESTIRLIPPSAEQAEVAAVARKKYPLNLGDCFAYALAKEEDCPLLTLDRDFRRTDVKVVLPGRQKQK
jgi:ribonuclease VapC